MRRFMGLLAGSAARVLEDAREVLQGCVTR